MSVSGHIFAKIHDAIFSTRFIQWVARWPRYSQQGPNPEKFGNLCHSRTPPGRNVTFSVIGPTIWNGLTLDAPLIP